MTIRQRAIQLCAIAASTPGLPTSFDAVCEMLGLDLGDSRVIAACELAALAWCDVDGVALDLNGPNDPARDAEAECLLREGWRPW